MLENTLYQLTQRKKLTIGYFGGSITEGAGASDGGKTSYRALVTTWFRETYPEAEITAIQAAIGGTGSDLGVHRCDRDLLSEKPDLIFFEFSVNDDQGNYNELCANTEGIFRKILRTNPNADIVVLHTTTKSISDRLNQGEEYLSRSAHAAMAHAYGIPQIEIGEGLRHAVTAAGEDWLAYTTDTVHPNDAGYRIYTDIICTHLNKMLTTAASHSRELPSPFTEKNRENAHMQDAWELSLPAGWEKVDQSLCSRFPHYIECTTPGAELTVPFTGREFGLYWMLAADGGDIDYRLDGGEWQSARAWDHYCKAFNRASGAFLLRDLSLGPHEVTIRVAETKAEESTGTAIRIGALLIC